MWAHAGVTFGDPCCRTVIRASLNAKASAIRGEATNSDRACPSMQRSLCLSSTIHPRPAVKVSILQDASQLIMAHSSGTVGYIIGCIAIVGELSVLSSSVQDGVDVRSRSPVVVALRRVSLTSASPRLKPMTAPSRVMLSDFSAVGINSHHRVSALLLPARHCRQRDPTKR
ncbi:hypothetical protein YC2023_100888 [Brassica napus]